MRIIVIATMILISGCTHVRGVGEHDNTWISVAQDLKDDQIFYCTNGKKDSKIEPICYQAEIKKLK